MPQIGAPNPGQAHCRRRKTGNSQSLHDFPKVKLKALRTPWTSFLLSKIRRFSSGSKGTWDKSATNRGSGGGSAFRADDSSPQGRARAKPAVADPQSSELRVAPRGPQGRSGLSAAGAEQRRRQRGTQELSGVGGLAAPTLGRGQDRSRASEVDHGAASCHGAASSGKAAATALPGSPSYLSFPGPAQRSGLAPAEVSQPSALGPAGRRGSPRARLALFSQPPRPASAPRRDAPSP